MTEHRLYITDTGVKMTKTLYELGLYETIFITMYQYETTTGPGSFNPFLTGYVNVLDLTMKIYG